MPASSLPPRIEVGGISASGLLNDVPHRVCSPSLSPHAPVVVCARALTVSYLCARVSLGGGRGGGGGADAVWASGLYGLCGVWRHGGMTYI
eukprot:scaffold5861_cov126-Isochrysis_galbana.AAC.2